MDREGKSPAGPDWAAALECSVDVPLMTCWKSARRIGSLCFTGVLLFATPSEPQAPPEPPKISTESRIDEPQELEGEVSQDPELEVKPGDDEGSLEHVFVVSGIDSSLIQDLRLRGYEPYTVDIGAIRRGLGGLARLGALSPERETELRKWFGVTTDPKKLEVVIEEARFFDSTWTAEATFKHFASSLLEDELASVLLEAGGLQVEVDTDYLGATGLEFIDEANRTLYFSVEVQKITDPVVIAPELVEGKLSKKGIGGKVEDSERLKRCSELATAFNRLLEAARSGSEDSQSEAMAKAPEILEECFYRANDLSLQELEVFGVILGSGVICGAVLISPDSIVTARHCIYNEDTDQQNDFDSLRFYSWLDPERGIPLKQPWNPIGLPGNAEARYHPTFDFVGVKLLGKVEGSPRVCWDGVREAEEALGLAGYFAVAPVSTSADWRNKIVVSTSGVCFAKEIRQSCFVHYCQATPGFSGAPLFGGPTDDCPDGVRVVGLHLGQAIKGAGCTDFAGNQGVTGRRVASLLEL